MTLHRLGLGLTVLLALLTGGSGVARLSGVEGALLNAARWGFTPSMFAALGAMQLVITALFVVPRTALLGGLLQLAYFDGAIAHARRARRPGGASGDSRGAHLRAVENPPAELVETQPLEPVKFCARA